MKGAQLLENMARAFLFAAGVMFIASGAVSMHHPMNAALFAGFGGLCILATRYLKF